MRWSRSYFARPAGPAGFALAALTLSAVAHGQGKAPAKPAAAPEIGRAHV